MDRTIISTVMKKCANYTAGYICAGAIIRNDGSSVINKDLYNKLCLIKEGKECEYFEKLVKPIIGV